MPDQYWTSVSVNGDPKCLSLYQDLAATITSSNQLPSFLFPAGACRDRILMLYDDGGLMVESGHFAPVEFGRALYHYLWKIDPYIHLIFRFNGTDEGEVHWIYGAEFIK